MDEPQNMMLNGKSLSQENRYGMMILSLESSKACGIKQLKRKRNYKEKQEKIKHEI